MKIVEIFRSQLQKNGSIVSRSRRILSKSDQKKIVLVVCLQILMGLLDLLGIAIIGILGALAVSGVESHQPGNRVALVLKLIGLSRSKFQTQAAILGILATAVLVCRTIISVIFTKRTLYFLSRRGATISANLVSNLLRKSLLDVQSKSIQETIYSVTTGVTAILLGVLGTTVSLIADTSLLLILGAGLFAVDPSIAISALIVFSSVGFVLYKLMNTRARKLGQLESKLTIASNEKISEVLHSYREAVVKNRRDFYIWQFRDIRMQLAETLAETTFLPNISKYVIETTMVLGALFVSAVQFILQDATHAVATLSVFLAAGTRIAPAVLRIQQGSIAIRGSLGAAGPTLDLIESFPSLLPPEDAIQDLQISHEGFEAKVTFSNVSFSYPGQQRKTLSDINLKILPGEVIGIVGSSGAGKTTLVDLLLGILAPDTGDIEISSLSPRETVRKWPGAISYVPQDVSISKGTIRGNIGLGFPADSVTDELAWSALKRAHLDEFVEGLPSGLETNVGERGVRMSGGQRQRLGIARALVTNPHLLVLDEATSALDGLTELDISNSIQSLKGQVTVVIIAHRLSTVKNADRLIYLEEGRILQVGTFDELKSLIPNFSNQAQVMGL